MTLRILDPVAAINKAPQGKPVRRLATLDRKRMGLLWGRHAASVKFWPVFEGVAETRLRPTEVHKVYKQSTWNPAPAAEIEDLARRSDYAIIGVGA